MFYIFIVYCFICIKHLILNFDIHLIIMVIVWYGNYGSINASVIHLKKNVHHLHVRVSLGNDRSATFYF